MRIVMEALGFGEGDRLGGSVRVAATNARALAARGHEVLFLCTNRIDSRSRLFPGGNRVVRDGVNVAYLDTKTIPFWPGCFGPHYARVPQAIKGEIRCSDIVHLSEYRSFLAQYAARLAIACQKPLIVQPQGSFGQHAQARVIKYFYDLFIGNRLRSHAACFIATTKNEAGLFARAGIHAGRIAIVGNGIQLQQSASLPKAGGLRAALRIPRETPLILSVGRLHEIKGFDLMLQALQKIPAPAKYFVVGPDFGHQSYLVDLAKRLQLTDRFLLTGPLPHAEDVQAAIMDADIFVVPSRYEAFGQVILEAGLASRPLILSSGCDVAPEFAPDAAMVVAPEPGQLAAACNKLLREAGLRECLGTRARQLVEREYGIGTIAAKLERIYFSCQRVPAPQQLGAVGSRSNKS